MMREDDYKLVRLANGAYSIHSVAEGETFHPVVGPVAEAEALYVNQLKLCERAQKQNGPFVIWDVGLGAAANVITALRATRDIPCSLRVVSFDRTIEPLRFALRHAGELGYLAGYESQAQRLIDDGRVEWTDGPQTVQWELRLGDFPQMLAGFSRNPAPTPQVHDAFASDAQQRVPTVLDPVGTTCRSSGCSQRLNEPTSAPPSPRAILFDAFSPAKNPAMWTAGLFSDLFQSLDPNCPCAMPTYSRSTLLRVTLLLAGFFVGVGHATGEKEETTIAANTLELIDEPLPREWLERAQKSRSAEPLREPVYRQAPLTAETWEALCGHPQFGNVKKLSK